MHHTCKNCGTRVVIPEEWLILGINKRIKCKVCHKRYNLSLDQKAEVQDKTKRSKKTGTLIFDGSIAMPISYKIKIKDEYSGQLIGMKDIIPGNTYIIGRDPTKIQAFNGNAVPIIINSKIDPAISRIHLMLTVNDAIMVEDLKSRNGTYLIHANTKEKLKENDKVYLNKNDQVKIGKQTIISIE